MGASNFELVFISMISSTWDCTTFHNFLPMFKKKIQKLAGLWLAGEMVNHVGIYESKAAEGLSAFQRRSCNVYCNAVGAIPWKALSLVIWIYIYIGWAQYTGLYFQSVLLLCLQTIGKHLENIAQSSYNMGNNNNTMLHRGCEELGGFFWWHHQYGGKDHCQ